VEVDAASEDFRYRSTRRDASDTAATQASESAQAATEEAL
jgi:hypothetical protein